MLSPSSKRRLSSSGTFFPFGFSYSWLFPVTSLSRSVRNLCESENLPHLPRSHPGQRAGRVLPGLPAPRCRRTAATVAAARRRWRKSPPRFRNWKCIELIGQGGMGFVYKVRQPSLDRIVALKILSPGAGPRSGLRRALRPRGARAGKTPPPEHRHRLRTRRERRFLLPAHGIRRWREPPPGDARRALHAGAGAGHRARHLRRAAGRPRAGRLAPRHQAGEHPARRARAG